MMASVIINYSFLFRSKAGMELSLVVRACTSARHARACWLATQSTPVLASQSSIFPPEQHTITPWFAC